MDAPGADHPDPGAGGTLQPPEQKTFLERHGISPVTFAYLCVIFFFVVYQIVGTALSLVVFGFSPDLSEPGGLRAFTGISELLLLMIPAFLAAKLASRTPVEFMRFRRPSLPVLLVPLAGIISLQQMLQVYLYFQGKIPLPPEVENLVSRMKEAIDQGLMSLIGSHSVPEFLGVVLVIAVIPGVAEEFAFRGVIQRSFEKGIGPVRGIAVTGIIFGAFHLNPFSIVPLVALGIYLGFLAYRADSIWVSVAAHFFNNLIPVTAFSLGFADKSMVTGGVTDMPFSTAMLMFWFSGVIFLLSTYYFLHLTRKPAGADRGAISQ